MAEQNDLPTPPVAPRRPHLLRAHGQERTDDWYWLAQRDDPEVVAYLERENAYADAVLAPLAALETKLYDEIRARVVETDVTAPSRSGPWWYWSATTEGLQYSRICRLADPDRRMRAAEVLAEAASAPDVEVVLDENVLAGRSEYFALGVLDISPDHRMLAYAIDLDGSEDYVLRFRDLSTGTDLSDEIDDVHYGSAWASDNHTFFFVRTDDAHRPFQVWRHRLGDDPANDDLVFEELDERFNVAVGLTRSERFIVVSSESTTTSRLFSIHASDPAEAPTAVLEGRSGIEYDLDHVVFPGMGDAWVVRTNAPAPDGDPATNFAVRVLAVGGGWDDLVELVAARPDVKVEAVNAFSGYLVCTERQDGLERLRVLTLAPDGTAASSTATSAAAAAAAIADDYVVPQPDPVYALVEGANSDFDATELRFGYTSLVSPMSAVDWDLTTRHRQVVRTQPVRGYRPEDFESQRIWATAPDGTRIPISLVAKRGQHLDGSAPCLLYGYGSYEITIDPTFSSSRLNLVERGVTFAIAHVRGGGELGRQWYEDGKLANKANTFTDFVACAEHLIDTGWTSPDRLVARGGSAGGLLMGAVTNLRPELWRAVVAEVPFVDVVTTMSDPSIPLTVPEWEEWGNPVADEAAYRTMAAYSPYDNVAAVDHPAMYVTAGLHDPRVAYWEPAKWVAKIRTLNTGDAPVLLRTELGAGHQGPSGRYDAWRDEAKVQAFILSALGITD